MTDPLHATDRASTGRSTRPLRLGTRRSLLATTQSNLVADLLRAQGWQVELVVIVSEGDRSQAAGTPITGSSATGVFVSALRTALLAGEIDLAVHSLKDLPTAPAPGITLAAVPEREDPRDVLVARDGLALTQLPAGARVGTGSPRRAAQLRALGLGLDLVAVRGNVDSRIGKVASGEYDAVVLARAGLARIARLDEVTDVLDAQQILPAPGQGALAVECRSADAATLAALAPLDHPASRAAVLAERAVLARLEGGCAAPIGTLAQTHGDELRVSAVALSPDGARSVRREAAGPVADAHLIGVRLAEQMLADGAAELADPSADPTGGHGAAPEQDKVHNA
ncbi:MAG: hydroxymethylbilane synthase [Nocardioides sp.]|uniref:hydroxymethylbilane synthase n=1 Tax=Nocardioides sp. TaxID=35761 RepID=UPI0039E40FC6